MKEMWRFNKKSSRILAGFLAMMLVFSNIAANVQTVYAAGPLFQIGGDGEVTPVDNGDELDGGTLDGMEIGAPADDEEEYDFHVSIWPEMEKIEDTEGEESDPEEAQEVWTGKWLQYMYDGQETDHTLGQELLMSDKYADEYGPLDMDLPGTWEGDNDEVMEVYPDGTALVKNEGTVNVTFTYEDEAITDSLEEDAPAEETETADLSEEKNTTGDDQAIDDLQTVDDETTETVTAGEEETEAETEAEDETETEAEAEVEDETEAEAETEVEDETEAEAETETEAETEVETEAEAETKTTVSAGVSTAAPENEKETEPAAVKKTKTAAPLEVGTASVKEKNMAGDGQTIGDPQTASDEPTADSETAGTITTAAKEAETEAESEAETEAETETEAEIETIVSTEVSAVALENEKETEPAAVKETKPAAPSKEETASGKEKNTAGDGQTIGDPQTAVDEPTADDETAETVTTAAEEAAPENRVRRPSRRAVKETEAEATESRTEEASEDRSDETESVPVATGSNAAKPEIHEAPEEEAEMELEPGTVLTWVVCVKYVGPALMANTVSTWDALVTAINDGIKDITVSGTIDFNGTATLDGGGATVKRSGNGTLLNVKGGSLTLKNITFDGENRGTESGVKVNGGTLTLDSGATIQNFQAEKYGGGIWGHHNSTIIIDGGTVTGNKTAQNAGRDVDYGGGGIFTAGTLELKSGSIEDNTSAGSGGGIFLYNEKTDRAGDTATDHPNKDALISATGGGMATFKMTGGTIKNNTAQNSEGGGIYCETKNAEIYAGTISGNRVECNYDFGGGGIFIESKGHMIICNALITGNTAANYGGGLAGCTNGVIYSIPVDNGVAIFDNTAEGAKTGSAPGEYAPVSGTGEYKESDTEWNTAYPHASRYIPTNWVEQDFLIGNNIAQQYDSDKTYAQNAGYKGGWNDYYCARDSVIASQMLGGGSANWYGTWSTGSEAATSGGKYRSNGTWITGSKVTSWGHGLISTGTLAASGMMGLTANPTSEAKEAARNKAAVYIQDNYSASNGGGITCNGLLDFGQENHQNIEQENSLGFTFQGRKYYTDNGEPVELEGGEFTFVLNLNGIEFTTTNEADGTFTFNLTADQVKSFLSSGDKTTLSGNVREVKGTDANIYYDTKIYNITATVTKTTTTSHIGNDDNGIDSVTLTTTTYALENVTITGQGAYKAGAFVFTNEKVRSVTAQPKVSKKVTIKNGSAEYSKLPDADKEFEFQITQKDGPSVTCPANVKVSVGELDKAFEKAFGSIEFTEEGTYHFTISEASGTSPNIDYTDSTIEWTVIVGTDGSSRTITSETYSVGTNAAEFVNKYTQPVTATPVVEKVIALGNQDEILKDKTFRFTMTVDEAAANIAQFTGKSVTKKSNGTEIGSGYTKTGSVTINKDGTFDVTGFEELQFNRAGTYAFLIKETVPNAYDGYFYDESMWKWTVTVSGDRGTVLTKTENYEKLDKDGKVIGTVANKATFTNTYRARYIALPLQVHKDLTGVMSGYKVSDVSFTFNMSVDSEAFESGALDVFSARNFKSNEPRTSATLRFVDGKPSPSSTQGTAKLGYVRFKKPGTYTITVKETQGNELGYHYDGGIWNISIAVVDAGEGQLKISELKYTKGQGDKSENGPDYNKDNYTVIEPGDPLSTDDEYDRYGYSQLDEALEVSFENEYAPEKTFYTPMVTKVIEGSATALEKEFTFSLEEVQAESGRFAAGKVISSAKLTLKAGEANNTNDPVYASFDTIEYTKAGTYKYLIKEVKPENAAEDYRGYTFDDSVWTLLVNVQDYDGKLKVASATYIPENGISSLEAATFTNNYKVTSTEYAPRISKVIVGDRLLDSLRDTEFRFEIAQKEDYSEDVVMPDNTQTTVNGVALAYFDKIKFNAAGTYEFTVKEVPGEEGLGFTYDTTVWNLTVTVADDDSDLVVAGVKYEKDTSGDEPNNGYPDVTWELSEEGDEDQVPNIYATFVNTFGVEVKATLKVRKVVETLTSDGELSNVEAPAGKVFNFHLENRGLLDGVEVSSWTASVTGSGEADFGEMTFSKVGRYVFAIYEDAGDAAGYDYDPGSWTVEINVVDVNGKLVIGYLDDDGTLIKEGPVYAHTVVGELDENGELVRTEVTEPETNGEAATFTNRYQVKATQYAPDVKKTVLGNPLEEEQFNFTMESGEGIDAEGFAFAEGDIGRQVTVNGAGTGKFGGITFKKAGTYTFKIKETSSNSPFWADDDRTWTLTVVVEDEDSKLVVKSHTYVRDGEDSVTSDTEAEFENEFHGPGDLSISKTVSGNRGEMTRAFNVIVTFTNLKGEPLAGTYEYAGSSTVEGVEAPADGSLSGGVLNITLAHGQKITIKGIPADTKYTVTETEADTEEYQTSVEVNGDRLTGDEAVGEVVRDTETVVEYLNYRNRSGGTTPGGPGPGPDSGPGPGPGPDTGSGPDSGPDSGPGPSPEFELITDEPTPLSSFKNLENIEDEDVPLAFLAPMTGDNKPVGAAALFGLVALGVMGAFGIKAFKKDEDDKH